MTKKCACEKYIFNESVHNVNDFLIASLHHTRMYIHLLPNPIRLSHEFINLFVYISTDTSLDKV